MEENPCHKGQPHDGQSIDNVGEFLQCALQVNFIIGQNNCKASTLGFLSLHGDYIATCGDTEQSSMDDSEVRVLDQCPANLDACGSHHCPISGQGQGGFHSRFQAFLVSICVSDIL